MLRRVTTALVAFLVLGSVSVPAWSDPPQVKSKRVSIFPTVRMSDPCRYLFEAPKESHHRDDGRITRYLEQQVASLPDVTLVPARELRNQITSNQSYKEKLVVGRERYLFAKELYRDLRQTEANDNLTRSIRILERIYYDVVEPESLAQIHFLQGVTRIEMGRKSDAHISFKEALSLHPTMRVPRGYYPKPVEQALLLACEDLKSSPGVFSLEELERASRFMKVYHIDAVLASQRIRKDGEEGVALGVLERKSRAITFREFIPDTGKWSQTKEMLSRAVSRWGACTPKTIVEPKLEERHRYVFSASYQQMAYLSYPTRSMLNSIGFSFESGFFLLRNFALVAKLQFTSSLPDRFGDMLSNLSSFRLILGPAFSVSGDWWRLYVVPGAEVHMLGAFSTSSDPDCKFFKDDSAGFSAMCPEGRIKDYPVTFLGGVNVSLGAQFFFSNRLFLNTAMSISTYFMPFDRSIEMNFPVAFEAGGGIAF